MPYGAVKVKGLRELQRDFRKLDKDLGRELTSNLKEAAEPVRATAAQLAASRITNIGAKWAQMKVGATSRVIYVAPAARRRGGSPRPNLGGLLLKDAMLPALDRKQGEVIERIDKMLGRLAGENGF